jgi:hypothetical protein
MHNFKYHTVEELERLMDNLKVEIEHLRRSVERSNWHSAILKGALEYDEDMLRHAEFEIMERTLLK